MEFSTSLITDKIHEVEEEIDSAIPVENPPEKRRTLGQGILQEKDEDKNMYSPQTQRRSTDRNRSTVPARSSFSPTSVDSVSPKRSRPSFSRATKEVPLPDSTSGEKLVFNVYVLTTKTLPESSDLLQCIAVCNSIG
jgi:hypothetical protein